jgi:predicted DNA-binding transcriptional regulator YafY
MGSLSAAETPAGIVLAFFRRRQWRQSDLARELDVTVETLLRSIRALSANGMPLVRDDSDKPHVWWRVPKDWAPQGVLFSRADTPALLRALSRAPRSRERDVLLAHASRSARVTDDASARVQSTQFTDIEQAWLSVVEDAAKGTTLGMRYVGTGRATPEWRYVSVQHVEVGPPSRFIGVCHRSGTLKRFRVEGISLARLDAGTPFRRAEPASVEAVLRQSIDGYRGEGEAVECAFFVRDPEARWVALNLPSGMAVDPNEDVRGGVRVRCSTPGVLRVARFVVGLGEAARVETPELAACVREIARGALKGSAADGLSGHRPVERRRLRVRGG